ncbi:MAG TPA: CGGC domain-containing protein [Desulfotomaculum sp.]|nr:CGGC domain-containing protein [Desulfotomaculum sp.]
MARIGIITCSNCTQDLDCASVVCLADMRKRKGFFQDYPADEKLELVGIINCAGCPTVNAPAKILRRVRSIAEFRVDAIHFSFCMTAVCPFIERYVSVIQGAYPNIRLVMGTHTPRDPRDFQEEVRDLLCAGRTTMADLIKGRPVNKHLPAE